MTRLKGILGCDDVLELHEKYDGCVFRTIRAVEQAVLAKLAGQEPVAWFIDDKRACGNRVITDLAIAKDWLETNPDKVTPLYAHPMPCVSPTSDKTACGAENAESDTQETIAWIFEDDLPNNYPYEAMFKYSKVDGVRMFPVYAPSNCQGILDSSNHIEDKRKMIPEGYTLVPVEADQALLISMACCLNHGFGLLDEVAQYSMLYDMEKLYDEVVGAGYYSQENRERYLAMLAAAPKYTGDSNE